MSKVYLIKSFSIKALQKKINELSTSNNIFSFDLEEDKLSDIVEEANYISLFNEKKNLIVRNMKYFSNKGEYKKENEMIEKYLQNENENTTIIFITNDINLKNKNVKSIKDNNNLIIISEYQKQELDEEIKKYIKEYNFKINNDALTLLKNKCLNNYDIILNELDKLFLLKDNDTINVIDIKENVSNMLEDNFEFINAVVSKKSIMFKYLDDLIELKVEPTIIVGQLVNQYKLIYFVKDALTYISEPDIANALKMHPYRVKLAVQNSFNYTNSELDNIINKLIELDLNVKDDFSNKYQLIKIFLLNLIK